MTALIRAAAAAQPRLILNEASTRGEVTVLQNCSQVSSNVLMKSVESGMSTTRLR